VSRPILICLAVTAAFAVVTAVTIRNRLATGSAGRAICPVPLTPRQAENRGLAWLIGGFVICPCHLPLTLGLVAGVFAGTAMGAVLSDHLYLVGTGITLAWLATAWRGIRYLKSARIQARVGQATIPGAKS
jgi:hypothetical protein